MSTSPMLNQSNEAMLTECPVGMILRESPATYDALDAAARVESTSIAEFRALPLYMQSVARLAMSERARHMEMKDKERKYAQDSRRGTAQRRGHA